jgi:hypothetical protein
MRYLLLDATVVTNAVLCAAREKGGGMQRFTNEGTSDQEGRELIPAHRNAEEEPLGLSFEGEAGARTLSRRQAIGLLGGSLAGAGLLSLGLAAPAKGLPPSWFGVGDVITLRCQASGTGYLDGHTVGGTVGLAPNTKIPPYSGTRWEVLEGNKEGQMSFKCLGTIETQPTTRRYLDGVTAEGSVQLAPSRAGVYTGTYWEVSVYSFTRQEILLRCLGTGTGGNRYLIGRGGGNVGLAPEGVGPPGTRWKAEKSNPPPR